MKSNNSKKWSIYLSFCILFLISCKNDNSINHQFIIDIDNNKVGNLKLGNDLKDHSYNNSDIKIITRDGNRIYAFSIISDSFRTLEGIKVGDEMSKIQKIYNAESRELTLQKGNTPIGDLGHSVYYKNIIFIDSDKDGKCDFIEFGWQ